MRALHCHHSLSRPKISSGRPHRSSLVGGYGGRVCHLHVQWHMGFGFVPCCAIVVTDKWIFKHKFKADRTFERYKACWFFCGFTQRPSIDYDKTSILIAKLVTVRIVLSLALSRDWPIHQLDVKNAFLHGTLIETIYYIQSTGFFNPAQPDLVSCLNKSLYSLKQAPRAWYDRFASYLLSLGFVKAKSDTSLFIFRWGSEIVYLLLYVDDIVLTASGTELLQRIISTLQREFSIKDLGQLHHFFGISVQRQLSNLLLSQRQYMMEITERAGMVNSKPFTTLVDTSLKLSGDSGDTVSDPTHYHNSVISLQYLTFTHPDISYTIQ
jgi:hypothetical protein